MCLENHPLLVDEFGNDGDSTTILIGVFMMGIHLRVVDDSHKKEGIEAWNSLKILEDKRWLVDFFLVQGSPPTLDSPKWDEDGESQNGESRPLNKPVFGVLNTAQ